MGILRSIDFEILEDGDLLGEVGLLDLSDFLPQLLLLLLLSLYGCQVGLEREEVLANFVHPQRLRQFGVGPPVVGGLHFSRAWVGDVQFGLDGPQTGQHVILIILAVVCGEPVINKRNSDGSERFSEVQLS